ncbi:MAG: hypothetical protein ACFFB5_10100 [Promethearchaeota archaeon]
MLGDHKQRKQSSLYLKIFGGSKLSVGGPLFFLIMGLFCSLILFIILFLGGTYNTGVFNEPLDNSGRPPLNFPFSGIIFILLLIGAVIGLFLGIIGLLWYSIFLKNDDES